MTVVARRIIATPARPASEAWAVMVDLLAPDKQSEARKELESVAGIASNLIADEAFEGAVGVVYGSGPRVRLYCLYGDKAISGDRASESALAFNPTEGDWRMSLPCPAEDLAWVRDALKERSSRITARDMDEDVDDESDSERRKSSASFEIDTEAFFNS
ncbi:MAG: hypothetical protein M3441_21810 [Chloroflexota bacterium]|nr:hypothetical protein [Chloroflexota bacterium]